MVVVDRGDRRARQPRRRGRRRAVGRRPARVLAARTTSCRCSRRASGCCSSCCTSPAASCRSATALRDALLRWVERRLPPLPAEKTGHGTARVVVTRRATPPRDAQRATAPCSRRNGLTVQFGGLDRGQRRRLPRPGPARSIGLIGNNGAGKSTLLNAIGGYVPSRGTVAAARARHQPQARAPARRARARPHVPERRRCSPS